MLPDYQTLVASYVRDDAQRLCATDIATAIAGALERYSSDSPRALVADITNAAGNLLALPAGWEDGFSELQALEYPLGNVPPTCLADWAMYVDPTGSRIMLVSALPANSTVRATFTVHHQLTAVADTVPLKHREALAKFAAASLCDQLAAFYASDTDPTLGADRSYGQTRSQAWSARANAYRKQYLDAVGVPEKTQAAAGKVVSLISQASLDGRASTGLPGFFHAR